MPENFISFPTTSLDGDNLPTVMTGHVLHQTTSITGLSNGTAYRTFVLQNPSDAFTPVAMTATSIYRGEFGTAAASTVRTTTLDLTGYVSGDQIIIAQGDAAEFTTPLADHTLQGIVAAEVRNHGGPPLTGRRVNYARFVLDTTGSASAALSMTFTSSIITPITVWGIKNGVVALWNDFNNSTDGNWPYGGTGPTPASATNIVIATMFGQHTAENQSATWSPVEAELFDGYLLDRGTVFTFASEARFENVAASPYLPPAGSIAAAERSGGGLIVITPA